MMKLEGLNEFMPYKDPQLEATEGKKPKASKLLMTLLIYNVGYLVFAIYIAERITDQATRNIICAVLALIAIVLVIATGIQNRRRPDKYFVWSYWTMGLVISFVAALRCYLG